MKNNPNANDLVVIRELFSYCPISGYIYRTISRGNRKAGTIADHVGEIGLGYICIKVNNYTYLGHNIAWFLYYGKWPSTALYMDHINRIKTDNRIINLRLCTASQNKMNTPCQRKRKYDLPKGVSYRPGYKNPYAAYITVDGIRRHLGFFSSSEKAQAAYIDAAKVHHGKFACWDSRSASEK